MSEAELFDIVIVGGLTVAALLFVVGWYFTHRVPLESLYQGRAPEPGAGPAVAASQTTAVTGYGIAGFATAIALWPVSLTDPGLGLVICCILGPSVIALALKGLAECRHGGRALAGGGFAPSVGGRNLSLAALPIVVGAAIYAIVGLL
jgi:hypothetical protein